MESLSLLELALIGFPIVIAAITVVITMYVFYYEYLPKKRKTDLDPSD